MNNFYWTVYKNLERELLELSNLVHIDDKQLEIYSVKISELLIRTVVEIESISKELYFKNGGTKPDDNNLFFDTDCIDLLESKWLLSKKKVQISASNFYFTQNDNKILTPLNKANKRGSSSSDWKKAYQAIKHNRVKSLTKGNLKNLIRAMAGLYLLNLYFKDNIYTLDKDATATNFDNSLGSSIFSVKLHINQSINIDTDYTKNEDYDESIYIVKPTDETRINFQQTLREINDKTIERTKEKVIEELSKNLNGLQNITQEEVNNKINTIVQKVKTENMIQVARENGQLLKQNIDKLKYEAVLNKQQY
jgi:hypothetical protein